MSLTSKSLVRSVSKAESVGAKAAIEVPAKTESLLTRMGTSIIHVKVGKELKDFGIHKGLICGRSSFFCKAFNSESEEGKTGIMKMEELDTKVFDLFFVWLYSPKNWYRESHELKPSGKTLFDLYLFAETVRTPALRNAALSCLHKGLMKDVLENHIKSISMFNYIWDNTAPSSPMRRLMIDLCVWKYNCEAVFVPENACLVRSEIYAEIVRAMWNSWKDGNDDIEDNDNDDGGYYGRKPNPLLDIKNYVEPMTSK